MQHTCLASLIRFIAVLNFSCRDHWFSSGAALPPTLLLVEALVALGGPLAGAECVCRASSSCLNSRAFTVEASFLFARLLLPTALAARRFAERWRVPVGVGGRVTALASLLASPSPSPWVRPWLYRCTLALGRTSTATTLGGSSSATLPRSITGLK